MARLDELLKAAGDPTRLRILNLLGHGTVCVCDLQQVLELAQPTVSRHLAVLRHADLVSDTRSGNRMMYSLTPGDSPTKKSFFEFLQQCCGYEEELGADSRRLAVMLRRGACTTEEATAIQEEAAL